jgi:hypothetical protein
VPVDERQILTEINALVDREHQLRSRVQSGEVDSQEEHTQLAELEGALDQCWDLLRQRRAHREFGQDVDESAVRPSDVVEGYQQ